MIVFFVVDSAMVYAGDARSESGMTNGKAPRRMPRGPCGGLRTLALRRRGSQKVGNRIERSEVAIRQLCEYGFMEHSPILLHNDYICIQQEVVNSAGNETRSIRALLFPEAAPFTKQNNYLSRSRDRSAICPNENKGNGKTKPDSLICIRGYRESTAQIYTFNQT